ncbi:hypothetical protein HDU92_008902 [Lobulomyces angularis]|nr:hypothetical protein HDU92_008902 [Lobulomyces angularis]
MKELDYFQEEFDSYTFQAEKNIGICSSQFQISYANDNQNSVWLKYTFNEQEESFYKSDNDNLKRFSLTSPILELNRIEYDPKKKNFTLISENKDIHLIVMSKPIQTNQDHQNFTFTPITFVSNFIKFNHIFTPEEIKSNKEDFTNFIFYITFNGSNDDCNTCSSSENEVTKIFQFFTNIKLKKISGNVNSKSPISQILQKLVNACNKFKKNGFLAIIGDAGNPGLQAKFEQDVFLFLKMVNNETTYENVNILRSPSFKFAKKELLKFLETPYMWRAVLFGGHSTSEGKIIFHDGEWDIGNELKDFQSEHGSPGYFLFNCCFAHQILKNMDSTSNGTLFRNNQHLEFISMTDDSNPFLPAGGIVEKLQDDPNRFEIFYRRFAIKRDMLDQLTNICKDDLEEIETRAKIEANKANFRITEEVQKEISDGLYLLPGDDGDCYIFKKGNFVILFDSGHKFKTFATWCWNSFIFKYIKKIDIAIISHSDEDHLGGLNSLLWNKNLNDGNHYPMIKELWLNVDSNMLDTVNSRSPNQIKNITQQAKLKDIRVKDNITTEIPTYYNKENGISLTILNPTPRKRTILIDREFKIKTSKTNPIFINNSAILLKIQTKTNNGEDWSALLCSDVSQKEIVNISNDNNEIKDCIFNIVTIPHHGSADQIDDTFFKKVQSKQYFISANPNIGGNDHPRNESIAKLVDKSKVVALYKSTRDRLSCSGGELKVDSPKTFCESEESHMLFKVNIIE